MIASGALRWSSRRFGYVATRRMQGSHRMLASFPIPDTVRESVKSSLLEEAISPDSRLWESNQDPQQDSSIDGTTNRLLLDPLDDWHLGEIPQRFPELPPGVAPLTSACDPMLLCERELQSLSQSISQDLLGTDHPVLNKAAAYFFQSSGDSGKKVRPMMILLLSRALSNSASTAIDDSKGLFSTPLSWQRPDLPAAQRRLAEIAEMIHTASLFHDDVIDGAETRRGNPAVHMVFGNKMAILAGDYLLSRASIYLARLRHVEVVECISTVIEHLVRGEVMQVATPTHMDRLEYSLRKNFYKTASLMAQSCQSAALLGNYPWEMVEASYRFGKHIGTAFQLVDDVLDLEGSVNAMGKPALSDLKAGLSTVPVLLASHEYPQLEPLVVRKFRHDGDVERGLEYVLQSNGIQRTKELAQVHAELATDAILELSASPHRDALIHLAYQVILRTK